MGRGWKRALVGLACVVAIGPISHVLIGVTTKIAPPAIAPISSAAIKDEAGIRRLGPSYARRRAGIREVYLEGSPEEIGAAHSRLLREGMIDDESEVWGDFAHFVPVAAARTLMMDVGRVRYREVDQSFPEERKREIAAEALGFQPDPFASHLPTYHRLVFLHSLYDIALSFEHSPLIGCSAFVLGPGATRDGHTLLGRAFDFEAGDEFDRDKAVFFVRENGAIPFASVAWPGLVGVLSGMNAEGVAIVVNGARAREPRVEGEPVVFALRDVLERAHDVDEAVALLKTQPVMVSHLVLVADAKGRSAIVERAPDVVATVRTPSDPDRVPLTNHFEGPLASDPKNLAVLAKTTTGARRERLDEILRKIGPHEADVPRAVAILRDHDCAKGVSCPLGDRREIDALIATHGIVADTTDRVLWVSAGPHLSGAFVRFDLKAIFAPGHDPANDPAPEVVPADPILGDGRYAAGRAHAGGPRVGGDAQ
ncbi:MAG: C45 family autoproteolytic acyltransferase/hydolase [Polyangiaceae bacterium]